MNYSPVSRAAIYCSAAQLIDDAWQSGRPRGFCAVGLVEALRLASRTEVCQRLPDDVLDDVHLAMMEVASYRWLSRFAGFGSTRYRLVCRWEQWFMNDPLLVIDVLDGLADRLFYAAADDKAGWLADQIAELGRRCGELIHEAMSGPGADRAAWFRVYRSPAFRRLGRLQMQRDFYIREQHQRAQQLVAA